MNDIQASEEKYRGIVEEAKEGIAVAQDGRYVFANKSALNIIGYTNDELKNIQFIDLVHPEDRGFISTLTMERLMESDAPNKFPFRCICKGGIIKWVEIHVSIVKWNGTGRPAALHFIIDTTAKRIADEQLFESEEKYKILVEKSNEGIMVAQDEKFVYVNQRMEEILAAKPGELIGKPFVEHIHPDDVAIVMERYGKRIAGDAISDNYYFRVIDKNNKIIWLALSAKIMQWKGRPATLNMFTDITQQKLMEQKISRLEKMESLGLLAGGVAHNLNNILGIVMGYSELLLLRANGMDDIKSDVDNIIKGSERAAAIIQDLVIMARGGIRTESTIKLNNIINKCIHSDEFAKINANIKIETDFGSDLSIIGTQEHLNKAIMNLLYNAVDSMKDNLKDNVLKIVTTDRHLYKPINGFDDIDVGDYVVLSISDTGDGIDTMDLPHIFEPFYTKKSMNKTGTGLGLSVVWGIIKDHQGYIDVQSEVGVGTTFTLYFPVSRKNLMEDKVSESLSWYKGNGEHILIVDDVEEQRALADRMLEQMNYNVVTVSSGEEAIEYVKSNKVDVIVLDMIMDPGIDGLEAYKRIKEINPEQKIIIMTGFLESEKVTEVKKLDICECIKKPYKIETLGLAVYKTINGLQLA